MNSKRGTWRSPSRQQKQVVFGFASATAVAVALSWLPSSNERDFEVLPAGVAMSAESRGDEDSAQGEQPADELESGADQASADSPQGGSDLAASAVDFAKGVAVGVTSAMPSRGAPDQAERDALIKAQLHQARIKALDLLTGYHGDVEKAFDKLSDKVPAFVKTARSFSAKWYGQNLAEAFHRDVLSESSLLELKARLEHAYAEELSRVDNEVFVALNLDVADEASLPLELNWDVPRINRSIESAIAKARTATHADQVADFGQLAVSTLISNSLNKELVGRSGLSGDDWSSRLKAGALTLLGGLAADAFVTKAYETAADPDGELQRGINVQLEAIKAVVIDGSEDCPALTDQLMEYEILRAAQRQTRVEKALASQAAR
ncbi:hypothetical protein Pan44_18860 [Caulifigura coniformis]|uniref:Uncharacterized protein n=1 Tax=Caulifigura coniformis TaxID=2527983 RepID=A0A517SCK1_9PLAN|nr:hypothetical protein [Caulifigura coniformis]QDT53860.1 hypothetical protein Pan44_18860 [Caulifigura coniformis]